MIYITGDLHGSYDFKKIKNYFENEYVNEKDVLIILGDAGIVWDNNDKDYRNLILTVRSTIIFIDGNHENFELLNEFPVVTKYGARMHHIGDNVYHVLRGEVMVINSLKFFCLGGATSIDKEKRINRVSWWEEENITSLDIENGLNNLKKVNYKVDYVLTHAAPNSIIKTAFGYKNDMNSGVLERFLDIIKFKHWYFGHYHVDRIINDKFRCFYQNILKIESIFKGKRNATSSHYVEASNGYLINWETGRKTKLTKDDLGEYYYGYCQYEMRYYKMIGVKDVAYRLPLFDNHIDKDASIYLSYKNRLKHNDKYAPINDKE